MPSRARDAADVSRIDTRTIVKALPLLNGTASVNFFTRSNSPRYECTQIRICTQKSGTTLRQEREEERRITNIDVT